MNFKTSEKISKVLPAVIKTQKELPPMGKDRKNPHAKSEYLTLDKINSILYPIANENEIFISQLPVERMTEDGSQGIGVDTILWHSSGEYLLYPAVYYEFEKGGRMNMTQSVGSIITYAKRYALTSIFGISTNEDDDGVGARPEQPKQSKADKKRQEKWEKFEEFKQELFDRVQELAAESMQPANKINAIMLKRTSDEIGEDQEKITPENLATYNKYLRAAEAKFKADQVKKEKQREPEEDVNEPVPLLKGNTTEIAEENKNE